MYYWYVLLQNQIRFSKTHCYSSSKIRKSSRLQRSIPMILSRVTKIDNGIKILYIYIPRPVMTIDFCDIPYYFIEVWLLTHSSTVYTLHVLLFRMVFVLLGIVCACVLFHTRLTRKQNRDRDVLHVITSCDHLYDCQCVDTYMNPVLFPKVFRLEFPVVSMKTNENTNAVGS